MATIDDELNVAEQAHEALNELTTIYEVINALSRARDLANAQQAVTSLSGEEALNNSRHEVVIAFNNLIRSLQGGLSAQDKIEKARRAVEDWVKELRALQAQRCARQHVLRHQRAAKRARTADGARAG